MKVEVEKTTYTTKRLVGGVSEYASYTVTIYPEAPRDAYSVRFEKREDLELLQKSIKEFLDSDLPI